MSYANSSIPPSPPDADDRNTGTRRLLRGRRISHIDQAHGAPAPYTLDDEQEPLSLAEELAAEMHRKRKPVEEVNEQFEKIRQSETHIAELQKMSMSELIEEARRDAEAMSTEMRAKAAAEIQAERERLRREIDIAKDQAIKQLWEQSAQLAALISSKAIGRALTEDDHRRLIDESLHELTTLNN